MEWTHGSVGGGASNIDDWQLRKQRSRSTRLIHRPAPFLRLLPCIQNKIVETLMNRIFGFIFRASSSVV